MARCGTASCTARAVATPVPVVDRCAEARQWRIRLELPDQPSDTWDYTATQHIILADLRIKGELHKVLMQAPKNAFFYVIDRKTGELRSAEKFAPANWARHVDMKTGRPIENPEADWTKEARMIFPSPFGARTWPPMSFNPKTGLVYIPMQESLILLAPDNNAKYVRKGVYNVGVRPFDLPQDPKAMEQPAVRCRSGSLGSRRVQLQEAV